jgi:Mitochondrial resolvase Ydc2 / RNA splicing MRS1
MGSPQQQPPQPKRQRILSFDVGIRHLAYCEVLIPSSYATLKNVDDMVRGCTIEKWDIIDLDRVSSVDMCCRRLTDELHRRFPIGPDLASVDVVLVERQPKHRSIMMVAIQMFLCCYFNTARASLGKRCCAVHFMHASKKLLYSATDGGIDVGNTNDVCSINSNRRPAARRMSKQERQREQAARYKDNKKRAVDLCSRYLSDVMEDFANPRRTICAMRFCRPWLTPRSACVRGRQVLGTTQMTHLSHRSVFFVGGLLLPGGGKKAFAKISPAGIQLALPIDKPSCVSAATLLID